MSTPRRRWPCEDLAVTRRPQASSGSGARPISPGRRLRGGARSEAGSRIVTQDGGLAQRQHRGGRAGHRRGGGRRMDVDGEGNAPDDAVILVREEERVSFGAARERRGGAARRRALGARRCGGRRGRSFRRGGRRRRGLALSSRRRPR